MAAAEQHVAFGMKAPFAKLRVASQFVLELILARSPGEPLGDAAVADLEPRFRHDFSRVRVHSGAVAERSAWDLNANAYKVEHDIGFDAGRFGPEAHEGWRLIAHAPTRVVQQWLVSFRPIHRSKRNR